MFITLFFLCQPSSAQELSHLQGLNNPEYRFIKSNILSRGFHIYVRTPLSYTTTSDKYPVVYLLDGGHTFPMLASYYQYLSFEEKVPNLIIVGISYGNDDWRKGNQRSTDFTAKAASSEHYGGAAEFQVFLKNELIPYIENHYHANSNKRILFGQSLGGQFVLYSAQTEPNLFWGHIASNPALHRNLPFFLEYHGAKEKTGARLFVSSGSEDDARFRGPILKWMKYWSDKQRHPWILHTQTIEGEGHFSAAPTAFKRGLNWLFGEVISK